MLIINKELIVLNSHFPEWGGGRDNKITQKAETSHFNKYLLLVSFTVLLTIKAKGFGNGTNFVFHFTASVFIWFIFVDDIHTMLASQAKHRNVTSIAKGSNFAS